MNHENRHQPKNTEPANIESYDNLAADLRRNLIFSASPFLLVCSSDEAVAFESRDFLIFLALFLGTSGGWK